MKKLCLSLITFGSLIFAMTGIASVNNPTSTHTQTPAKAVPANANKQAGYYSTKHPLSNAKTTLKATLYHPTDIAVVNASNSSIYVIVPGTFPLIKDYVFPNSPPDHIVNDYGSFWTALELHDARDNYFWSGTVCDHALVTVYGYLGSYYNVNVDNSYCS